MKFIDFDCRTKKLMKIKLFNARITKIMKFLKFHAPKLKIIKKKKTNIASWNHEYQEVHKILIQNHENHEHLFIPR